MNRARLEAFSDGVFAVAITLLALNLAVDGPGHGSLAHLLADRWPAFIAYLISFFTIGIIWVNHHALVSNVAAVSRSLLFLNLVFLLFVVMVPFATVTVANYLAHGGFDARVAVAVYGGVLEGMSLGFAAMLEWSLGEGRTYIAVPPGQRWAARLRFTSGGLVYLLVIGVAFLSAPAALGLTGLVAVYYIFERTPNTAPARPGEPPRTNEPPAEHDHPSPQLHSAQAFLAGGTFTSMVPEHASVASVTSRGVLSLGSGTLRCSRQRVPLTLRDADRRICAGGDAGAGRRLGVPIIRFWGRQCSVIFLQGIGFVPGNVAGWRAMELMTAALLSVQGA